MSDTTPDTFRDDILSSCMTQEEQEAVIAKMQESVRRKLKKLPTTALKLRFLAELNERFSALSPYFWATRFARTYFNKANIQKGKSLFWPFQRGRYIWLVLTKVLEERQCGSTYCLKPRRNYMSWTYTTFFTWKALYRPGEIIAFVANSLREVGFGSSKAEPDALLARSRLIYELLPRFVRDRHPAHVSSKFDAPSITFYHWDKRTRRVVGSAIKGVPIGSALRGGGWTALFLDEVITSNDPEAAEQAIGPAIRDGGYGRAVFSGTSAKDSTVVVEQAKNWLRRKLEGDPQRQDEFGPMVDIMPYSDSYDETTDPKLSDILADQTDLKVEHRLLARKLEAGNLTLHIKPWAQPGRGKTWWENEALPSVGGDIQAARREYLGDLTSHKTGVILWLAEPVNFVRCKYDPDQPTPFDTIFLTFDFGHHGACVWIQKCKTLPGGLVAPGDSYQVRILGELDFFGQTWQLGQAAMRRHIQLLRHVRNPFGIPIRYYADTAGQQTSALSRERRTHIDVLTDEIVPFDPLVKHRGILNQRVRLVEGIAEVDLKLREKLGEHGGMPVMGLVIDPVEAPLCRTIFSGAGQLDPDKNCVKHGGMNEPYEHAQNVIQYLFAQEVNRADIWRGGDAPKPEEPQELTRKQILINDYAEQKRVAALPPEPSDDEELDDFWEVVE